MPESVTVTIDPHRLRELEHKMEHMHILQHMILDTIADWAGCTGDQEKVLALSAKVKQKTESLRAAIEQAQPVTR